jgi:hypothetical protein
MSLDVTKEQLVDMIMECNRLLKSVNKTTEAPCNIPKMSVSLIKSMISEDGDDINCVNEIFQCNDCIFSNTERECEDYKYDLKTILNHKFNDTEITQNDLIPFLK